MLQDFMYLEFWYVNRRGVFHYHMRISMLIIGGCMRASHKSWFNCVCTVENIYTEQETKREISSSHQNLTIKIFKVFRFSSTNKSYSYLCLQNRDTIFVIQHYEIDWLYKQFCCCFLTKRNSIQYIFQNNDKIVKHQCKQANLLYSQDIYLSIFFYSLLILCSQQLGVFFLYKFSKISNNPD